MTSIAPTKQGKTKTKFAAIVAQAICLSGKFKAIKGVSINGMAYQCAKISALVLGKQLIKLQCVFILQVIANNSGSGSIPFKNTQLLIKPDNSRG